MNLHHRMVNKTGTKLWMHLTVLIFTINNKNDTLVFHTTNKLKTTIYNQSFLEANRNR